MIVDVELGIVGPDRLCSVRDPDNLLAVARDVVEDRGIELLDGREVDAAFLMGERTGVEDLDRRHVHG